VIVAPASDLAREERASPKTGMEIDGVSLLRRL
jgi:hypothetical protein